jgi:hypothetical protein
MLHQCSNGTNVRFVERVPGKVSGALLFKGTSVPVKALFENLEALQVWTIFCGGFRG